MESGSSGERPAVRGLVWIGIALVPLAVYAVLDVWPFHLLNTESGAPWFLLLLMLAAFVSPTMLGYGLGLLSRTARFARTRRGRVWPWFVSFIIAGPTQLLIGVWMLTHLVYGGGWPFSGVLVLFGSLKLIAAVVALVLLITRRG